MSAQDENRASPLARPDRRRFIVSAAALAAGMGTTTRSLAQAPAVERVPLSVSAGLDTSPLFAAIDQGIFRQHNIVITPNIFFTGVEHVNSAASGQSMIATMNPLHLQAADKASLVRAVAAAGFQTVFVKGRQKRNFCLMKKTEQADASAIPPAAIPGISSSAHPGCTALTGATSYARSCG